MRNRLHILLFSILCSTGISLIAQAPTSIDPPFQYPMPEGKYQVGTKFFSLTDRARPDLFTEESGDYRQISLRIWYPAKPEPGARPLPYYRKEVADAFIEMGLFYDAFLGDVALQPSCSFLDAPILETTDPFPLVIYSSSGVMNANIFLFENLASHGYVVVCVGHPHWCVFYYDEEGNPSFPDYSSNTHYQRMWEEERSEAVEQLKERITLAGSVQEKSALLEELNRAMPVEISDVRMWVQDFDYVTGELAGQNVEGKFFQGMLDLDRICVTGYSKGGVAAAHACLAEDKYAAGINLSGFLFGDIQRSPVKVPFLNLESEEPWCENCESINDIMYHTAVDDIYMVQIKGATHGNFTDLSAFKNYITEDNDGLLGPMDGKRFLEIQTEYILNFLNRYLKNAPYKPLQELTDKYGEVRFKTNTGI